jgi:hypothetical protein
MCHRHIGVTERVALYTRTVAAQNKAEGGQSAEQGGSTSGKRADLDIWMVEGALLS